MKGIPEDASLLAKTLYKYGTSKSPVKRALSSGVMNLIEATGSKERTLKKNVKEMGLEKEVLTKFLNSKVTQNELEKLGVNSRTFNIAVFREYPFNTGKYDIFIRAFIVLRNELRENIAKNRKLNPSKYQEIIVNMLKYTKGDKITRHLDYIPMMISTENDSDESEDSGLEESDNGSSESEVSDISDYISYLGYLDDDKEELSERRTSVNSFIDNKMKRMQVGGFCYNAANKLKKIIRE
jgi:hypothetical protein